MCQPKKTQHLLTRLFDFQRFDSKLDPVLFPKLAIGLMIKVEKWAWINMTDQDYMDIELTCHNTDKGNYKCLGPLAPHFTFPSLNSAMPNLTEMCASPGISLQPKTLALAGSTPSARQSAGNRRRVWHPSWACPRKTCGTSGITIGF